jgi:hypothetical protein
MSTINVYVNLPKGRKVIRKRGTGKANSEVYVPKADLSTSTKVLGKRTVNQGKQARRKMQKLEKEVDALGESIANFNLDGKELGPKPTTPKPMGVKETPPPSEEKKVPPPAPKKTAPTKSLDLKDESVESVRRRLFDDSKEEPEAIASEEPVKKSKRTASASSSASKEELAEECFRCGKEMYYEEGFECACGEFYCKSCDQESIEKKEACLACEVELHKCDKCQSFLNFRTAVNTKDKTLCGECAATPVSRRSRKVTSRREVKNLSSPEKCKTCRDVIFVKCECGESHCTSNRNCFPAVYCQTCQRVFCNDSIDSHSGCESESFISEILTLKETVCEQKYLLLTFEKKETRRT